MGLKPRPDRPTLIWDRELYILEVGVQSKSMEKEDLAIKNMVKNHQLAKAISDASWGELIRQLAYKCQWYGRELVKIDRWFPSSKRCGNCGYMKEAETQIAMFGNPCAFAPGCMSTSC